MSSTLAEMRESYDWREAFKYASFTMDDVKQVIVSSEGENDGQDWIAVFELKDGRFAYLEAGCDYTGWDCQANGQSWVNDTLDGLRRWDMSKTARIRLNMALADLDG